MSLPLDNPLRLYTGSPQNLILRWLDGGNDLSPVVLDPNTGSITMTISKNVKESPILTLQGSVHDSTTGSVIIPITLAQVRLLQSPQFQKQHYQYDVQWSQSSEDVTTLLKGSLMAHRGVKGDNSPIAGNISSSLDRNTSISIPILSDTLFDINTVGVPTQPTNGTISISVTTGDLTYTPNVGYYGLDQFLYQFSDLEGRVSNEATVSLTITPVADVEQTITFGQTVYAGIYP